VSISNNLERALKALDLPLEETARTNPRELLRALPLLIEQVGFPKAISLFAELGVAPELITQAVIEQLEPNAETARHALEVGLHPSLIAQSFGRRGLSGPEIVAIFDEVLRGAAGAEV
jgi:hypothetical protein